MGDGGFFKNSTGPKTHIRCVCCGRIAPVEPRNTIPHIFLRPVTFDARIQEFIGNGRRGAGTGFRWTRRELHPEELDALVKATSAAADAIKEFSGSLDDVADDDIVTELDFQDASILDSKFNTITNEYIRQAEEALRYAENELEFRKKEVEKTSKFRDYKRDARGY